MLTSAWSVEGDQAEATFGISVAGGDLNGDGYGDLVVGSPDYDAAIADAGRSWLYLGSATGLDTIAAWTADSDQSGAEHGYSVGVGDVNGDGLDDVIAGSVFWDDPNGREDAGQAA